MKAETLDNVTHKDIRIITRYDAALGDNLRITPVVPREFRFLIMDYPIFITKNPQTGQFIFSTVLGFDEGENLFLGADGWDAAYIPMNIRRQPFLIGKPEGSSAADDAVVQLDMDSPRVSMTEGEPVFLPQGGISDFMANIQSILAELLRGSEDTANTIDLLNRFELIDPLRLDIEFANQQKMQFEGLFSIHEENLIGLKGDQLATLHEAGVLETVFLLQASTAQVQRLINKKNERLKAG